MKFSELTKEQQAVLHCATEQVRLGGRTVSVGGAAGTGKTSIVSALIDALSAFERPIFVAAPTNKAAKVLRDKIGLGAPISTLHKLLDARPKEIHTEQRDSMSQQILNLMQQGKDKQADKVQRELVKLEKNSLTFDTGDSVLSKNSIVIVDESSMVGRDMRDALVNIGVTAIFVGDPYQLPPVNGEPWFDVDERMTLQTVHRQANGSAILDLATAVRRCDWLVKGEKKMAMFLDGLKEDFGKEGSGVKFFSKSEVNSYEAMKSIAEEHDQVLTFHRNDSESKVRPFKVKSLNQAIRQIRGITSPLPTAGEKVVLTAPFVADTGDTASWFIGETLTLTSDARMIHRGLVGNKARFKDDDALIPALEAARLAGGFVADFEHESGEVLKNVAVSPGLYDCRPLSLMLTTISNRKPSGRAKTSQEIPLTRLMDCDYAAAITTHISQGSEWERVAVFVPPWTLDWQDDGGRSWLYTAVTRARSKLTVVVI